MPSLVLQACGQENTMPCQSAQTTEVASFAQWPVTRHPQVECSTNSDEQFGFSPGRSTVWQLLSVLEEWHEAIDKGKAVHALFLDVSKEFDRVDLMILLHKLSSIGISGSSLAWVSSYLKSRSMSMMVDHARYKGKRQGIPK